MSKIKLVVTIDEENYKRIKDDVYDMHDIHRAIISIRKGTPFDVLNKIREEIRDLRYSGGLPTAEICGYIKCLEIIDKYREESEET